METSTPEIRSWANWAAARSGSSATLVSVSSSTSRSGARPAAASASCTSATSEPVPKWAALMLTAVTSVRPASSHAAVCRVASPSTHRVSGTTMPFCSASGMKSHGMSSPRSGCCQRTSASTPVTSPVVRCSTGW